MSGRRSQLDWGKGAAVVVAGARAGNADERELVCFTLPSAALPHTTPPVVVGHTRDGGQGGHPARSEKSHSGGLEPVSPVRPSRTTTEPDCQRHKRCPLSGFGEFAFLAQRRLGAAHTAADPAAGQE